MTDIDKKVENMIKERLLSKFPETSFLGEETGVENDKSTVYWVCDPIAGTRSFTNNENSLTTSLALVMNGKIELAIVNNPITDELYYYGLINKKVMKGKLIIPSLNKPECKESVINFQIYPNNIKLISDLYKLWEDKKIGKLVSCGGSVAYNLAKVAKGVHSSYICSSKKSTNIWDIAAGVELIRKVGGKVTDFKGKDIDISGENYEIVASVNGKVHEEMLGYLKE